MEELEKDIECVYRHQQKRPLNRLQQYPQKSQNHVSLARQLQNLTLKNARNREFSKQFDPVFDQESILITPEYSTPDCGTLYMNAAVAALEQVENYDASTAEVLLKVIDYFASDSRLGSPDYEKLMKERNSGYELAEEREEEIEELQRVIEEEKESLGEAKNEVVKREAEIFAKDGEIDCLQVNIEELVKKVNNLENELKHVTADAMVESDFRLKQQIAANELALKNEEIRSQYENALLNEEMVENLRQEVQNELVQAETDLMSEKGATEELQQKLKAKEEEYEQCMAEKQELVDKIFKLREEYEQEINQIKQDSDKRYGELFANFGSSKLELHKENTVSSKLLSVEKQNDYIEQSRNSMKYYAELQERCQKQQRNNSEMGLNNSLNAREPPAGMGANSDVSGAEVRERTKDEALLQSRPSRPENEGQALAENMHNATSISLTSNVSAIRNQLFHNETNESDQRWSEGSDGQNLGPNQSGGEIMDQAVEQFRAQYEAELIERLLLAGAIGEGQVKQIEDAMQWVGQPSNYESDDRSVGRHNALKQELSRSELPSEKKESSREPPEFAQESTPEERDECQIAQKLSRYTETEVNKELSQTEILKNPNETSLIRNYSINLKQETYVPKEEKMVQCDILLQGGMNTSVDRCLPSENVHASPDESDTSPEEETHASQNRPKPLQSESPALQDQAPTSQSLEASGQQAENTNGKEDLLLHNEEIIRKVKNHMKASELLLNNYQKQIDLVAKIKSTECGNLEKDSQEKVIEELEYKVEQIEQQRIDLESYYIQKSYLLREMFPDEEFPCVNLQIGARGQNIAISNEEESSCEQKLHLNSDEEEEELQNNTYNQTIGDGYTLANKEAAGVELLQEVDDEKQEKSLFYEVEVEMQQDKLQQIKKEDDEFIKMQHQLEEKLNKLKTMTPEELENKRDIMLKTITLLRKSKNLNNFDFEVIQESLLEALSVLPLQIRRNCEESEAKEMGAIRKQQDKIYTNKNPFKSMLTIRNYFHKSKELINLAAESELQKRIQDSRLKFLQPWEFIRSMKQYEVKQLQQRLFQPSILPIYVKSYGILDDGEKTKRPNSQAEQKLCAITQYPYKEEYSEIKLNACPLISDEYELSEFTENQVVHEDMKMHAGIEYFEKTIVEGFVSRIPDDLKKEIITVSTSDGYYYKMEQPMYIKSEDFLIKTIRLVRSEMKGGIFADEFIKWLQSNYKIGQIAQKLLYSTIINSIFYYNNPEVKLFLLQLNGELNDYFVQQSSTMLSQIFDSSGPIDGLEFSELYCDTFETKRIVTATNYYEAVIEFTKELHNVYSQFLQSCCQFINLEGKNDQISCSSLRSIFDKLPIEYNADVLEQIEDENQDRLINKEEFMQLVNYFTFSQNDELTTKASEMLRSCDQLLIQLGDHYIRKYAAQRKVIIQLIGSEEGVAAFCKCKSLSGEVMKQLEERDLKE